MTEPLDEQLHALAAAVAAAEGRVPDEQLVRAKAVLERSASRLRLSGDHTVVALGGATGSGKSSLFNALSGIDLAGVGVRRPTTSWTLACSWGSDGVDDLLEWIGIPARHHLTRSGPLGDAAGDDTSLDGLVLLDMPDHDSVFAAHHAEVDRVIEFADLFIWVLDPQKYADAALHDNYLKPLGRNRDTTLVVLNQVDRLSDTDRDAIVADLTRLLDQEGLEGVPVIALSARTGDGLEKLRSVVADRVQAKRAARLRVAAELAEVAGQLAAVGGSAEPTGVTAQLRDSLHERFASICEVDRIAGAVRIDAENRNAAMTGWPPLRLFGRSKATLPATAAPELGSGGQRARMAIETRSFADAASRGLNPPWQASTVAAAAVRDEVPAALVGAVEGVKLPIGEVDSSLKLLSGIQWLLLLAFVAGAVWAVLGATGVVGGGWLAGLIVALVGLAAGVVLTVWGRERATSAAQKRAEDSRRQLVAAVSSVVDSSLVSGVEGELDAHRRFREAVAVAARPAK